MVFCTFLTLASVAKFLLVIVLTHFNMNGLQHFAHKLQQNSILSVCKGTSFFCSTSCNHLILSNLYKQHSTIDLNSFADRPSTWFLYQRDSKPHFCKISLTMPHQFFTPHSYTTFFTHLSTPGIPGVDECVKNVVPGVDKCVKNVVCR